MEISYSLKDLILRDWQRCHRFTKHPLTDPCFFAILNYRLGWGARRIRWGPLKMLALFPCLVVKRFVQLLFDIYVEFDADIGPGFCIIHKGGVRVVSGAKLGSDVTLVGHVTIGRSMPGRDDAPVVGNGVCVSMGGRILGNVTVGDNVVVGANAVVVSDMPSNGLAVGVPARFIPKDAGELSELIQ